ncbi:MAG: type II secretion system minor pseudopilin GspI [Proteobacteria bacterium]|nr:type II secretion system minor pseudopilin GspI [Pseudomonadota bacterium]
MMGIHARGFTLVEVLVGLIVVALSLAALMSGISSAARGSEYLRDKTVAQWIALNRITEVRLNVQKFGESGDKGEISFANRKWRYDTRYFDTDNATIRRVVVRVWPQSAKEKAGPLAESASFLGSALMPPGSSSIQPDWRSVSTPGGPGTPGAPTADPKSGGKAAPTGSPPGSSSSSTQANP